MRAVAFPRKLLNTDEELVVDLRPHWWFFAGPAALLAASLVLLVVGSVAGWPDYGVLPVAGVTLGALVWFAGRYARWATTNFVVTSDRIIYRSGVVSKRGIEIPLERVNTIFSNQSIFERMLRSGDLVIESGGEQGRQSFSDIPHPQLVQNEIYKQREANERRMHGGVVRGSSPDVLEQLDRLDDLRRRWVNREGLVRAMPRRLLAGL
jgi:uncharacterized membrane protein YdbT with pleckstrin-like domain